MKKLRAVTDSTRRLVFSHAGRKSVPSMASEHRISEDSVRAIIGGEGLSRRWRLGLPTDKIDISAARAARVLSDLEAGHSVKEIRNAYGVSGPDVAAIAAQGRLIRSANYQLLVLRLPTDRAPYGQEPPGPSCSGCLHYHRLAVAQPWGICAHEHSPRRGMLTYQTQGGTRCGRTPVTLPNPESIPID